MKKLKILMVAPSWGVYGGVEVYTAQIAREVKASGSCEVRVLYRLPPRQQIESSMVAGLAKFQIAWRTFHHVDLKYLRDFFWADVIHAHFPVIYATYPALLLGKTLIVTVEAKKNPKRHGRIFKWGLKIAHAQWFISKFVADTWGVTHFNKNCRIVPATSDLPSAYVNPAERKGFFFIARWIPLKGLEQLVEAYATANIDHAANPLYLFGDGPLRSKIEALIDTWNIRRHVTAPGFVSDVDKERLMSSCKWNLAPVAFPEDLGLTPIEARCCAVPSIVSRTGGLPEAAGDQALFCEPGDVSSLRTSIELAAAMDLKEYEKRSFSCRQSLSSYLPPVGFYENEYRRLVEE